MTDHTRIIDKIRKCLALADSSNPNEAAIALRQAQALMKQHNIDNHDLEVARACERTTLAGARHRPPAWEVRLAMTIADAFACQTLFSHGGWNNRQGQWRFIGLDATPEIASYAMDVLLRQAKAARVTFIAGLHHRCKRDTKTRRADLFCDGWASQVTAKIRHLAGTGPAQPAIDAYIKHHYPELRMLKPTDRQGDAEPTEQELAAFGAGREAGRAAQLSRSMHNSRKPTPALPA